MQDAVTVEPTVTVTDPPTQVPTTDPVAPIDPQRAAANELVRLSKDGFGRATFDGRYVPRLSSKYGGIVDPIQTTASGSHVFQNTDILSEFKTDQQRFPDAVLLRTTDFGQQPTVRGHSLWLDVVLQYFPTQGDVLSWCASTFPQYTAGQLDDHCYPQQLNP